MAMMTRKTEHEDSPRVGDILEDRIGNKMVIVDILNDTAGECYVLLNGRIKLVNPSSPFIIRSHRKKTN